jgi:hypothetical protein
MGLYTLEVRRGVAYAVIEPGDTLSGVLSDLKAASEIRMVCAINRITDPNRIQVGQTIMIPHAIIPNVTNDLFALMRKHARDVRIHNPWFFKRMVQTGGPWDLKNLRGSVWDSTRHQYFVFLGRIIRNDAPGNIHYGYVGMAALWSTETLLIWEAGKNQVARGISDPSWSGPPFYGDDPEDTKNIRWGIELYRRDHPKPPPPRSMWRFPR